GQERLKILSEEAAKRREVMKARKEVMQGMRKKTKGGLTKEDLIVNKRGRVVSKKKHEQGKRSFQKYLSSWVDAVKAARDKLAVIGFRPVGGKSQEGKELYKEAKEIYEKKK
ncbi:unnamed protein product, partial [Effrenium voratum]